MVNNVTKKTFFYKFLQLSSFLETLSLKKLIQQELSQVIALYQQQNPKFNKVNNWQQIATSLEEKIILCNTHKSTKKLVYRSAIAFSIANLINLPSLLVAEQLVLLLVANPQERIVNASFKIAIEVVSRGWIDFYLWDDSISELKEDRNLIIWLDNLLIKIKNFDNCNQLNLVSDQSKKIDSLFPLLYIYGRSFSLLQLGARIGLISLEQNHSSYLKWIIKKPNIINWKCQQTNLSLITTQEESNLLWLICLIFDYLAEEKKYDVAHWNRVSQQMSDAWLKFIAHCPFCGNVSQLQTKSAIARLGLIALIHWCLEAIFILQLEIIPQKEI